MDMQFRKWLFNETIDYDSREIIIPKGEILYHGTLESFDTRNIKTGGYDDVFWTTDNLLIARTYIPLHGSYSMMSVSNILQDKGKESENIRKSLGLTDKVRTLAWQKQHEGYQKLKYWDDKNNEFKMRWKEIEKTHQYEDSVDEFLTQWMDAENNYKKAQKEWKTSDYFLKMFVIQKMKAFGYEVNHDYFKKVLTDDKGNLLPATTKSVGKVLKIICKRDFKFYNYAYGKEGDLMDVDYHKLELFRKIENSGYDGIVINDFAQSDYHGNYGHYSIGFFKKSLKDLTIKQIRSQTHPSQEDWGR